MKRFLSLLLSSLLLVVAAASALAQGNYPDRPVRIIVPFPAGGPADALARIVGERLAQSLGKPFVIENKAGAGGNIGMEQGARAAPDGYTLTLAPVGNLTVAPALYAKLPYDPVKDFAPITVLAVVPNVLIVHPSVPAKTVAELVALAKAKPGSLNYASPGNGSIPHLAAELLHGEIVRALALPEVRERIAGLGAETVGNSPSEFAAMQKAEAARWIKIAREANIHAD